jgi:hypothetical protein
MLSMLPIVNIQQLFHIWRITFYKTIPLSDGILVGAIELDW